MNISELQCKAHSQVYRFKNGNDAMLPIEGGKTLETVTHFYFFLPLENSVSLYLLDLIGLL